MKFSLAFPLLRAFIHEAMFRGLRGLQGVSVNEIRVWMLQFAWQVDVSLSEPSCRGRQW